MALIIAVAQRTASSGTLSLHFLPMTPESSMKMPRHLTIRETLTITLAVIVEMV
jgi:hypothetical protein